MNELKIIAAMLESREVWQTIRKHTRSHLSAEVLLLQDCLDEYYDADKNCVNVDRDVFASSVLRKVANPKHKTALGELLQKIPRDVPVHNIRRELLEAVTESLGSRLIQSILSHKPDAQLVASYQDLLETKELADEDRYRVHEFTTMASLLPSIQRETRIALWPQSLNKRIDGGCVAGDHVLVFARPEVGKTATALNFCRGIAKKGHPILYCSNEDSITRLLLRAKVSFSGMETAACMENPDEADKRADAQGFNLLRFVEMYPGSVNQIEGLVKKYEPKVLIVDQLINLMEKKSDNYTLLLGSIGRGIRNLAKHYGLVAISFAQAGDSASGKLVLDLGDIDWSNTSLQACADLIVGIGCNMEFQQRNWRMMSLCKNKLSGCSEYFPVKLDKAMSRLSSIENT